MSYLYLYIVYSTLGLDLLRSTIAALPNRLNDVEYVLDLGCGPGRYTKSLCEAFPNAEIEGIDNNPDVIETAISTNAKLVGSEGRAIYRVCSIQDIVHDNNVFNKYDIVYANAALHWLDPIELNKLLPMLLTNLVKPKGGILAVQMPDTKYQTSHLLMETAALRTGFVDKIAGVRIPRAEFDMEFYHKLLSPYSHDVDIWSSEYLLQVPHSGASMQSNHPILDNTIDHGLRPFLKALGGPTSNESKVFLNEYERLLNEEYPVINTNNIQYKTGKNLILFPFRRMFIVCQT